jgi:lipooligosaccharide transport system ATP-binding protein
MVGEHVVVLSAASGAAVTGWLERHGRGEPVAVLGDWHLPLTGVELADFARTFSTLRYEVRVPTLDDLFMKLSLEP